MKVALDRDLSATERELVAAVAAGRSLDLAGRPDAERIVGADLLASLCTTSEDVPAFGVRVGQAIVEGVLSLEFATLTVPLGLADCDIGRGLLGPDDVHDDFGRVAVRLDGASGRWISFAASRIDGSVRAVQLRLSNSLQLNGSVVRGDLGLDRARIDGDVLLVDAEVAGDVVLAHAHLGAVDARGLVLRRGPHATAGQRGSIQAAGVVVDEDVHLGASEARRCSVRGSIGLDKARIAGSLLLEDLDLAAEADGDGPNGGAGGSLSLFGTSIGANLFVTGSAATPTVIGGDVAATACRVGLAVLMAHVHVRGRVELGATTVVGDLSVQDVVVDGDRTGKLAAFGLSRVEVGGSLWLLGTGPRRCRLHGPLVATSSRIGGGVEVHGVVVDAPDEVALGLARVVVAGDVSIGPGAGDTSWTSIRGLVDLTAATVSGTVRIERVHLHGRAELAYAGVDGSLSLVAAEVDGGLVVDQAHVGRDLDLRSARLGSTDGVSLTALRTHVGGMVAAFALDTGGASPFAATGGIRLDDARVEGDVTVVTEESVGWISARDARVGRSVQLRPGEIGVDADGCSVVMDGAEVGRELLLGRHGDVGTVLRASGAVSAAGTKVASRLGIIDSVVGGVVTVVDACIGDNLELHGVHIEAAEVRPRSSGDDDRLSLDARRVEVGGDLSLEGKGEQRFVAAGSLVLRGAKVVGRIDLRNASLGHELDLREASCWRFEAPPRATGGSVAEPVRVRQVGFSFQVLDDRVSVEDRLAWVRRQGMGPDWSPDPYEQLATFYRRNGNEVAAQQVSYEKLKDELDHLAAVRPGETRRYRWTRRPFRFLLGFGYQRWRAGVALAVVLTVAGLAFWGFGASGAMVSTAEDPTAACGAAHPCFQPIVYGADVVLPIIDFGQDDAWRPDSSSTAGAWAEVVRWLLIVVGWAISSIFVAAFTVLVEKR